jgi:hypothetical protein
MAASPRSDEVLALGRKLVEELGLEPSVDTLGRWMAHYIAELMVGASSASSENRLAAQERCFEAILALWKHRTQLPNGRRPFEDLEPIMRAIESLDPDSPVPRYFRPVSEAGTEDEEGTAARDLIEFAVDLDATARSLIGYALAEAADAVMDEAKDWVRLAQAAGFDPGVHSIVVRYISEVADVGADASDRERERFQRRIDQLEAFSEAATLALKDLRERLDALPKAVEHAPPAQDAQSGERRDGG